jgi:hypothetical protein
MVAINLNCGRYRPSAKNPSEFHSESQLLSKSGSDVNLRSMSSLNREFWQRHPGLVWSNPDADDAVRIRAALLRPRFERLLDIALEFGLPRVQQEWMALLEDSGADVRRVRHSVERMLANIEKGFSSAFSRN